MAIEEQTDPELVAASLEGNRFAYAELVQRHQDAVFGLAMSMARNREDAADMAQEAFIRAYSRLDRYDPAYAFRSWILRICANLTKNLFRKRTRHRQAAEQHRAQVESDACTVDPDYHELETALQHLPAKLGVPLRLKYMEGMAHEEIAAVLGIGVSASKMRIMRAKKRLMELLS